MTAADSAAVRHLRRVPWRLVFRILGYVLTAVMFLVVAAVIAMRIFGIEPLVVRTSSMEPTIMAGDLMLARPIDGQIQVGGVYVHKSPQTGGETAHRVISLGSKPGTWFTQGDNNPVRDNYELTDADFTREVVGWVPKGGYVINALSLPGVRMLMLGLPVLLFLPVLIPAVRRKRPGAEVAGTGSPPNDSTGDGDVSTPMGPGNGARFQLSRTDLIVTSMIAIAILGLLGVRTYLELNPVVIRAVAVDAPVTPGAMGLRRPQQVGSLRPGDVIFVTMPADYTPTLRVIIKNDPFAPIGPSAVGDVVVTSVDIADPAGKAKFMQLPVQSSIPTIVAEIPRLGGIFPVFATTGGFAGLIIALGLLATILMIRVSLAMPRRSLARESESTSKDDIEALH